MNSSMVKEDNLNGLFYHGIKKSVTVKTVRHRWHKNRGEGYPSLLAQLIKMTFNLLFCYKRKIFVKFFSR